MNGNVKSADGVSIAYRVEGSGNPTLVFVHGWCCDKSYWDPQVSFFVQKYTSVAVDLAGHGESGLERDSWTMDAFGEDVAAVVNQLAAEQVVLIGHSLMGTEVCFETAKRIPNVVGLVPVDALMNVNQKAPQASLDRIAAMHSSPPEIVYDWMRNLISRMFIEKSDPALVERITSDMCSEPLIIAVPVIEDFYARYDICQALEKTTVPVRCISADHPFDLEAVRQYCPSCKVVFMSGVGHFVMLEDPITFNNLLEEIVQNLVV